MEITVSDILKSPGAVMLYQQMQTALTEEARRREEFREWLTEDVKAEFINGEVVLHSPVKRGHYLISDRLNNLLRNFVLLKKLGTTAVEKALIALTRNDYEPDISFWGNEKAAAFNDNTMLHPAPDFIVEILSPSTKKHDRETKFEDYALHGIREYWIIDPDIQCVEQYALLVPTDTTYLPYGKFFPGEDIKSIVLPEFEIPIAAIFDEKANFEALKKMMG
ncbi:MAG: Uma2 family endonuclease [Bacteroidales bacterium]|nr:Uma2 family endonuclease [Bacteroidales bacterium]